MYLQGLWLLLLVHFAYILDVSLQCSVCVLDNNLYTAPDVKCPICTESEANGYGRDTQGDQDLLGSSYGGHNERKINWTTCFLDAPTCDASSKYRTIDGSCNNLNDPMQGMVNTVYVRLLPAHYQDHKHAYALGSDGQPKVLARILRTSFFPDHNNPDDVSLIVMQWGQFLDHDMVQKIPAGDFFADNCCSPPSIDNKDVCMPIMVPSDDYFFSQFNVTCISEIRNAVTVIGNCNQNQPGQQYTNVSHEMDGSQVYGPNLDKVNRLRTFQGGRLKIQQLGGREFLPDLPPDLALNQCPFQTLAESCFEAGDTRVIQNPQLAVIHNLMLREHNRIADKLQELHPEWNDETVYQETRRIVVAIIQHISYNEWLELYIGTSNMIKFKLYPRTSGYTEYTGDVNFATINSFVAAAYRVSHSGIQGLLSFMNYQRLVQRKINISDWMNRPSIIGDSNNYDELLLGLVNQPMQYFEQYFTEQMSNLMFHTTNPYGEDLISMDIERGRDHGLAPYIHYHEICTGYHVTKFPDLYTIIPREQVDLLKTYYNSVEDIDLYVGCNLEYKVPGTRLGPTSLCIITEQFYRKKWGDRFWYEVKGQLHSFTRQANGFGDLDQDELVPLSGIHGNTKINWTTCFVHAQPCNPSYKYRTIDGSCNNLKDPTQGMVNTAFRRHLPPHYQDHRHAIVLASDGQPKPLSRALRLAFFPEQNLPDDVTLVTMQWGQVIAHDMVQSEPSTDFGSIDCCSPQGIANKDICLPIFTPSHDNFYSQFNVTCTSQIRNNVTLLGDCNENQPGQQYNNVTHVLDASLIYGSTLERSHDLRTFQSGKLRIQVQDGRSFLPNYPLNLAQNECFLKAVTESCYFAGDSRVVQNPQLAVLQTLFLRLHNSIADKLQALHPEWDDETVYQETRAIVIAIIQHITYNEWLELYIGKTNMIKYKLYPRKSGYTEYNADVNLATINSFVTAAYRFPHSGIQGFLSMMNYHRQTQSQIAISDWMNRPSIIQESNNYDQLLLGLANQPMEVFDRYFTKQITDLLFHDTDPFGADLEALDIERGRDHGLAPYIHYLEICTGYRVRKFEDLYTYIPIEQVLQLKTFYNSVQDIDLMLGGSLEYKVPDTRFGPTFLCLNIEQFYRKKWGDRFWYEVQGQPHSFTIAQLNEIRKITLSRLICDNSDDITNIAINSFLPPNTIVPCNTIPAIDLNKWK